MTMPQTSVVNQVVPFAGVIDGENPTGVDTYVNAETTQSIPFGCPVFKGTGDKEALIAGTDPLDMLGIAAFSQHYSKNPNNPELDAVGLTPGTTLNVLKRGVIWVKLSEASITPASAVRFWQVDHGPTHPLGTFGKTAESEYTTLIPAANARYLDSGGVGDFVRLQIDIGANCTVTPDT